MLDCLFCCEQMNEYAYSLKIDELNVIKYEIASAANKQEATRLFEDVLFDAYIYGFVDVIGDANSDLDYSKMLGAIQHEYKGVSIYDTMFQYSQQGSVEDIYRLLESEFHRVYSTAAYDAAKQDNRTRKRWHTVGDAKVRDTHEYLDGVTVDIDAEFMTYDGDRALFPGDFGYAENNANCRCWLEYA